MKKQDFILLPKELTAENGAKALLMGEFFEEVECYDEMEEVYVQKVPVEWDTIKQMYRKIVEHYSDSV